MRRDSTLLLRCPIPNCRAPTGGILCPEHWRVLSGPTRRALHDELKRLKAQGRKTETPELRRAFTAAWGEVLAAQATPPARSALLGPDGTPLAHP